MRASIAIVGPARGQVESSVEEGAAKRGDVGEENTDWAVLDAAVRPAVLALDTDRFISLLEEVCLVESENSFVLTKVLDKVIAQVVPCDVGVLGCAPQKVLQRIRRLVTDRFRQLPAVLALDRSEQPFGVRSRVGASLGPSEEGPEAIGDVVEGASPSRLQPKGMLPSAPFDDAARSRSHTGG